MLQGSCARQINPAYFGIPIKKKSTFPDRKITMLSCIYQANPLTADGQDPGKRK
jgi:hypothetical protein